MHRIGRFNARQGESGAMNRVIKTKGHISNMRQNTYSQWAEFEFEQEHLELQLELELLGGGDSSPPLDDTVAS